MADPRGMIPEPMTAKRLAAEQGWTEARAQYTLDGLVERGMATINANDEYTITGLGLGMGERLGIVKPMGKDGYAVN